MRIVTGISNTQIETKLPSIGNMEEMCAKGWDNLTAKVKYIWGRMPRRLTARVVTENKTGFSGDLGRYPPARVGKDRENWMMEVSKKELLEDALMRMEGQARRAGRKVVSRHIGAIKENGKIRMEVD